MSGIGDFTRNLTNDIRSQVNDARPKRAVAQGAASAGLTTIKRIEAASADGEAYARIAGFQINDQDEVMFLEIAGGGALVLGKLQRAAPTLYQTDAALAVGGDLTLTRHLLTSTTVPSVAADAAAGTTATAAISGTDVAMQVQIVPGGTGIATGAIFTVTFGANMPSSNYDVFVAPNSSAARTLGIVLGVTSRGAGGFDVSTSVALTSGSTYQWGLHVVGYG